MPQTITRMQQIQFDLMKEASFNDFNGKQVTDDLSAHLDLWQGAVMQTDGYTLRELPSDNFQSDTLWISIPRAKLGEFLTMAETWHVDECDEAQSSWNERDMQWSLGSTYDEREFVVYRLWWD